LYPSYQGDDARVKEIVVEAYKSTDNIFGVSDAIAWGEGFHWPGEVFSRDARRAEASGFNLAVMARLQQEQMSSNRLSSERISQWIDRDDPAFQTLMDLVGGMRLFTDDSFQPNNNPPPMRKLYRQVSNAVNKGFLEAWEEELVFIFPKEVMNRFGNIHYSPVHWTTKVGKESGRTLFDSSDNKHGCALNTDKVRDKVREFYGEINHPTINDIVIMILDYIDKTGYALEDLVLFKADLAKAFTLLSFRPENVHLLACELTDDLVMVYHSGLFGWTGTPFCFNPVTGAVERAINSRIKGVVKMYVDDVIGITHKNNLMNDKILCYEVCEGLLGNNAVAKHKWESGRRIDAIGWTIDLDTLRVTVARRNFMKTLYGFFTVNESEQVTVRELERLASWSSRYQLVLRHTRSLTTLLYAQVCGATNRNSLRTLTSEGQQAIRLWRMLLLLAQLDETKFTRSLESFRFKSPSVCIEYDASLTGIGLHLSALPSDAPPVTIGYGRFLFPFNLKKDPSNQNVCEFIAAVVGVIVLVKLNYSDISLKLRGDSRTSLKWGSTERFKGSRGLSAAVAYLLIGSQYNIWVSCAEHLPKEQNTLCDALSRNTSVSQLGISQEYDLELHNDSIVNEVVALCNPTNNMLLPDALTHLWNCVLHILPRLNPLTHNTHSM